MKTTKYRQGDVLLSSVKSLPDSVQKSEDKGPIILAWGEATGHHHSIKNKNVTKYVDPETMATYIEVAEAMALLEHQEHATIIIEPGIYRVGLQREYHPQEIKRVVD